MPGAAFVNPFRFRALDGGQLLLGAQGLGGRRTTNRTELSFLMERREVDERTLDALGKPLVRWLHQEHFLLDSPLDDEDRLARQRGFLSFWPGDPNMRQEQLRAASVTILGAGGLGSQVAQLLAAAGIGRLRVCDFDRVEPSNLNRQILYQPADVGRRKADVAAERLKLLAPDLLVEAVADRLTTVAEIAAVCADASVVVRAIDTPGQVAFMVNEACRAVGVPHVGGGFLETWALAGPFIGAQGPCLRCSATPPTLEPAVNRRAATFGPLTFWLSAYVAGDVLRFAAELGEPWLLNRVLVLDGVTGRLITTDLPLSESACPVCGSATPPSDPVVR